MSSATLHRLAQAPDALSGARVGVVGAGIAGLVAATRLREAGCDVTLFDAARTLGQGAASWFAGGMLAPFCEAESADASIVRPGLDGIDWWQRQAVGAVRQGTLVLAPFRDRGDLARFARMTQGHERCDAAAIDALEPGLGARFAEGLFFPEEGHLDPRRVMATLAERLGGALHPGMSVEPRAIIGDFDAVVDARGLGAIGDLDMLRAVRGEMLILDAPEVTLSRPVRLLHPRHPVYVVPRGEGLFMVGATMVESDDARGVTLRAAVELMNAAFALHPGFAEAEIVETGSGRRPAFPDNLPRAMTDAHGIVHLNGLYRHGFLLSPFLGAQACRLITTDRRSMTP